MKRSTQYLSLVMALMLVLSAFAMTLSAVAVDPIAGADTVYSENIKLNGEDTGVTLTQMILTSGSKYSLSREGLVNVIDINDAQGVTFKVLNGGTYNWSKATMGNSVLKYNETHADSTVLAAVNGDPWIVYHTDYDGDGKAETGPSVKHVSVSRGLQIIDGEIWATTQINDENNLAKNDNVERGTPASLGPVFAVLSDGSYMIGKPSITIKMNNDTQGGYVAAHGINRLPAPNSIILYNQRGGDVSMAFEDAYELYIESDDTAFALTSTVTGTVTHIFESGDTTERPAIGENTVVVSARGTSIKNIQGKYAVGDDVTFTCTVGNDAMGASQKAKWMTVTDAIGGFFTLIENGRYTGQQGNKTNYPCSIVGLREDGSPLLISTTPSDDGSRASCTMENLSRMCEELGLKTAILFDGGGSTTMVSLSGNNYVRRSAAVDGKNSVRPVINGLAVVYEGVDATPGNLESQNTAFLPDPEGGYVPEEPDPEESILKVTPAYIYRYIGYTAKINGVEYTDIVGRRDPNYSTSWTKEEKLAAIQPAVLSDNISAVGGKVSISGWALVNGGQGDLYWSVDGENWIPCIGGTRSDMTNEQLQEACTYGDITVPATTNALFSDMTADLSAYVGQTVTLRFAVAASGDGSSLAHFLTLESLTVSAAETEPETQPETQPETDPETQPATDPTTDIPTDAPETQSPVIEDDGTVSIPEKKGCSGMIGSVAVLLTAAAAAVVLKKKD